MILKTYNLIYASVKRNDIRKVDIVSLGGLTMNQWYNRQTDKPQYMLNASLWDGKGPIGTIWLGGQLTRNEGTGYGFGVSKDGFSFGDPWNTNWVNYITGYPALIQNGKKTTLSVDSYVQTAMTKRSAVCLKDDTLCLVTANSMTLNTFRNTLYNAGFTEAINLDGGGSSRLLENGKAVNSPTDDRACKLAIAIWTGAAPEEKTENEKPGLYTVNVSSYLNVRDCPSPTGSSIGKLTNGTVIIVNEVQSGWGKTTVDGKTGWVSLTYAKWCGDISAVDNTPSTQEKTHWAQASLDSLVAKGIISDKAQWSDFNAGLDSITVGQLLALVDKAFSG